METQPQSSLLRFSLSFRDDEGNEYLNDYFADSFTEMRGRVEWLYDGLVSNGVFWQISDDGDQRLSEDMPFRVGMGERDGDAA